MADPDAGTPPKPTRVQPDELDGLRTEVVELRTRAEVAEARAERAERALEALAVGTPATVGPIASGDLARPDASLRERRAKSAERALRTFTSVVQRRRWWR